MSDQRKKFEAWILEKRSKCNLDRMSEFSLGYCSQRVQDRWEAWQAAQKQQWTEIDYDNPETWPDSNKPIIRAWERGHDGKSEAFTEDKYSYVLERNERGNKLIRREPSIGIVGVFGKDEAGSSMILFTHWCYAPVFGGVE